MFVLSSSEKGKKNDHKVSVNSSYSRIQVFWSRVIALTNLLGFVLTDLRELDNEKFHLGLNSSFNEGCCMEI